MKSKVMNRPLFLDVENVGIMQGFKDEDYETGEMLDRTPSSPEILMNNLRGDMRSVDARIQELADLVGMEIASDTPPEVLALLQPVLAGQEGIASLPAGMPEQPMGAPPPMTPPPMGDAMPAPDMGMMPPEMGMPPPDAGMMPPDAGMMPQGPMPTAQAPLNMAQGGYVQRFRDGSDEEGVTPDDDDQGPPMSIDPATARAQLMNLRARQQSALPTLEEEMKSRLPEYQKLLGGGDRNMTQAQILFDIAQAGLNLAAGTDAAGKPVRPGASFASRLAGAAQALPERVAARVGQMEQDERGVRLAALKASESSIEDQRKMYAKLMEGAGSPFGKGAWEWGIVNRPGLMARWAAGEVTEEEDNLVQSALSKFSEPKIEFRPDPVTKQLIPVQVPRPVPPFVMSAVTARGGQMPAPTAGPTAPGSGVLAQPVEEQMPPDWAPMGTPPGRTEAGIPDQPSQPRPSPQRAPVSFDPAAPTLFNYADKGVGVVNVPTAWLSKIPFLGSLVDAEKETDAITYINNSVRVLNRALAQNPKFAEGEREQIQKELDLMANAIDRPEAYRLRLIGLDKVLKQMSAAAYRQAYLNPNLSPDSIGAARQKLDDIEQGRMILGAPPDVFTLAERDSLPPGSFYLWQGQKLAQRKGGGK